MKQTTVSAALLVCMISLNPAVHAELPWTGYEVIDMTHTFDGKTIYWPTEDGFELTTGFEGQTDGGYYYYSNHYAAADHGGTHLDAPRHFAAGKHTAEQVPLSQLMGAACVIDVSSQAAADRDYRLQLSDIEQWETDNGAIPAGCIVLMRTGFDAFWPDRERYMGTDKLGAEGVAELHFPGFSEESARALLNRKVAAIGVDTPSVDYGQSKDFIVHQVVYKQNIPGLENVANLSRLPATGAYVIALPMKIGGGSGAPLRIIGLVPN